MPPNINRPADIVYQSRADLSDDQATYCQQVFSLAVKTLKGADIEPEMVEKFWSFVFDHWKSTRAPTKPRFKNRQSDDSTIEVGFFKEDLPVGKGGNTLEERLAGSPAFMKIQTGGEAQTLSWSWCDASNRLVNKKYIQFLDDRPEDSFVKEAMVQYDSAELRRLCRWNTKMAIFIIRRRLHHWTKNGYPSVIADEDSYLAELEEIVLCRHLVQALVNLVNRLVTTDEGEEEYDFLTEPKFRVLST